MLLVMEPSLCKEGYDIEGFENTENVVVNIDHEIEMSIVKLKKKKKVITAPPSMITWSSKRVSYVRQHSSLECWGVG